MNLKEIESKSWKRTFTEDGLFDILLGFSFISALGSSFANSDYSLIPIFFIIIAIYWAARKYIVTPRIGSVKFGKQRNKKMGWIAVLLSISIIILVSMVFLPGVYSINSIPMSSIIVGFIIMSVMSMMGYFLDNSRLYFYGVMIGLAEPVGSWLQKTSRIQDGNLIVGIMSSIIIIVGIYLFIRFIKKYPKGG